MSDLGYHPVDQYGFIWQFNKIILVGSFLLGLELDIIDNFFFPLYSFLNIRYLFLLIFFCSVVFFFNLQTRWYHNKDKSLKPLDNDEIDIDEFKLILTNYHHADNLLHQRFNFFLVAESMLIISYATTFATVIDDIILIGICTLALIFTFGWFYVNKRLHNRLTFLNYEYLVRNKDYRKYLKSASKSTFFTTATFLPFILPLATFLFWYFLFLYTYWT